MNTNNTRKSKTKLNHHILFSFLHFDLLRNVKKKKKATELGPLELQETKRGVNNDSDDGGARKQWAVWALGRQEVFRSV